jgi:hypothetical protein
MVHPSLASLHPQHVENFVIHVQPNGLKYQASNNIQMQETCL